MDYPLENLDPERFQQFCQSLLIKEYPHVRCFPVAQPDGGRDAISFLPEGTGDKFIMFQIKYVRRQHAEPDPHRWLMAILEEEGPKVQALIPKGAQSYVLVTNIPGTAHLDKGSIDKLDALLTKTLGIPSRCWWRDDINRRLDVSWDLKWIYPELFSGPDFLRVIIESGLTDQKERRSAAIRAFLRAQYDLDEEVRFKQVELQNKLLDLFVDVPLGLRELQGDRKTHYILRSVAHRVRSGATVDIDDPDGDVLDNSFEGMRWHATHEQPTGAATFLLSAEAQHAIPHVVIEGAPGQGKSTIAQYICQIHRMRLLHEVATLASVEKSHVDAPLRLPIKVDLRDFALWLGKKDPFNLDQPDQTPEQWQKSLESFLAALIRYHSGGALFTVDDLLAICKITAVLLVLDGLDEVADLTRRQEVVAEIVRGVQRLQENSASMQTIVTSRPAAFANSPGMPHAKYPHLQLLSLPRTLILAYAERWLKARRLDSKQSAEFRSVLKEKLDQPHLRDLARNPMQLAILLSLVLTRGASLPDKRTALYDYYIDLFFSREAEKSSIVRNHRELLIDIHRHLAWVLQSQAEKDNARSSVKQEVLQQMVADYLSREGHDASLAKELFTGMVERVVALVSRVEGTFEFEVQPLQEYFAARHLYDTAPQSSPGKETSGSKPDRFDAIARNFYWLNVTRFYAGCYSKGELASLVERLQELAIAEGFDITSYPKTLAATLLGDWVFTQNPKSVQQVVELVLDPRSLRYVLAPFENKRFRFGVQNSLVLPPRCGRDELIKRSFDMLVDSPPNDVALQILELLRANMESGPEVVTMWLRYITAALPEKKIEWLDHGLRLGALSKVDMKSLEEMNVDEHFFVKPEVLSLLFRARRIDYLHATELRFRSVLSLVLDKKISAQPQRRIESPLDALSHAIDPSRYSIAFRDRQPIPLADHLERRSSRAAKLTWSSNLSTATESYAGHRECVEIARIAEAESQRSTIEWATDIAPWNSIVEYGRSVWGERWAFLNLATVAAGIRSSEEKCPDSPDLLDTSRPLVRRARYARLRPAAHRMWQGYLENSKKEEDVTLVLIIMLVWGSNSTLLTASPQLDEALDKLSQAHWNAMYTAVRRASSMALSHEERKEEFDVTKMPETVGLRFAAILADRAHGSDSHLIYERYIKNRVNRDRIVLEFVQREALDLKHFTNEVEWSPDLDLIKECYTLGVVFEPATFRRRRMHKEFEGMALSVARRILSEPNSFPSFLLTAAEERCRNDISSRVIPVAAVAEREAWFVNV